MSEIEQHVPHPIVPIAQPADEQVFVYCAGFNETALDRAQQELVGVERDDLRVVLQSAGGDIHCAFRLANLLRQHCERLEVIVPTYAKSAATFFCLSADRISLGPLGELGPLDVQTQDPRHDAHRISALDSYEALAQLRASALETFDYTVRMLIQLSDLSQREMVQHAREFTTSLMEPLYRQVRPLDITEHARALDIAKRYGEILMSRYAYDTLLPEHASNILHQLVFGYPTHEFVIDYNEAQALGLRVVLLDEQVSLRYRKLLQESTVGFQSPYDGSDGEEAQGDDGTAEGEADRHAAP